MHFTQTCSMFCTKHYQKHGIFYELLCFLLFLLLSSFVDFNCSKVGRSKGVCYMPAAAADAAAGKINNLIKCESPL